MIPQPLYARRRFLRVRTNRYTRYMPPPIHPAPARLLVIAQALDTENPALGFFPQWVAALAARYEHIEVICLTRGKSDLPNNVRVHTLGKERGRPLLGAGTYAWRVFFLAWRVGRPPEAR